MMKAAAQADEEDVIESSQIPTLRENVRKCRVFYGEASLPKSYDAKYRKKNGAKKRNNETVSQCMQREWKNPRVCCKRANVPVQGNSKEKTDSPFDLGEEYVKIADTQQTNDELGGIDNNPSVALFDRQRDVLKQYMLTEATEAEQEETLDQILQGFRASYEQANARMTQISPAAMVTNISPSPPPHTNDVQAVPDLGNEHVTREPLIEYFEPLVELNELPPKETTIEPTVEPMMEVDRCLDLSIKRDKADRHIVNAYQTPRERYRKSRKVHCATNNKPDGVLDLHISPRCIEPRANRAMEYVSQPSQYRSQHRQHVSSARASKIAAPAVINRAEHATQTDRSRFCRNAGIQHRPVASFDMTKCNVITLARMHGCNPDSLFRRMKDIATSSRPQALWYARHLPQVFSQDDPYFANVEYFMSPACK